MFLFFSSCFVINLVENVLHYYILLNICTTAISTAYIEWKLLPGSTVLSQSCVSSAFQCPR